MRTMRTWWLGLWLAGSTGQLLAQSVAEVPYELTRIDAGDSWVSSYWGYNAPKLVYDGEAYYTVALWGTEQATSSGAVYEYREGRWSRGYSWTGLNYQPGLLLLDSQQRLVLIYPRMNERPVVLRARAKGDCRQFDSVPVPASLGKAGYLGAGIHGDRVVLGYIGDPETYSFNIAVLDLQTQQWTGPYTLARAQRRQEPYTTWLYPIILPDETGFHLAVSNNADLSSYYDRILYAWVPYAPTAPVQTEEVARVTPWTASLAFAEAMWRGPDGSVYITGQYQPAGAANQLCVYRRDPQSGQWHSQAVDGAGVGAVFQGTADADPLWLVNTYGNQLHLHRSADQGGRWDAVNVPAFTPYDLVSPFFLHGIHPGSGSVMPEGPAAVFSAGSHPHYQLWFVRFQTQPTASAVLDTEVPPRRPQAVTLYPNWPNPFNAATMIGFSLPGPATVQLTIHTLGGQEVARLFDGRQPAGTQARRWDGRDAAGHELASGVYLCRLSAGEAVLTRKLLLLR